MFVSVGQTPRSDLISEMLASLDLQIEAVELGALDGLTAREIEELGVKPGEASIVTRLADNKEIVISKPRVAERTARLVAAIRPNEFDLVVILTTGLFRDFDSTCPTVNAQRAVESAVISLAAQGSSIGLIQPLEQQISELDIPALHSYRITASHALHNDKQSLARALFDLADCEIIVLNSVSFSEADREMAAKVTGKTVVLARRIIASAIRLLLSQPQPISLPGISSAVVERINRLTARERQVMSLLAEGLSNKAIARQLGISPKTVEIHRSNVMSKMEVTTSAALIRMVVQAGHP